MGLLDEVEAAHENKLTFKHIDKVTEVDGKKEINLKILKSANALFPQILKTQAGHLFPRHCGQINNGCNSVIKTDYNNLKGKSILMYLPLGKVLRNTGTKDLKGALLFIEKYVGFLKETGVIFDIECIGKVAHPATSPSNHLKLIKKQVDKINTIRKGRVEKSCSHYASVSMQATSAQDTGLEQNWIGFIIYFNKNIVSASHALAQVTPVRYLWYARYNGIAQAFVKICQKLPEINKIQALSLAHQWCVVDREYSAYYGLMQNNDLMSFPDDAKQILSNFKGGMKINEAFAKFSKGIKITAKDPFGNEYEKDSHQMSKEVWVKKMLPLIKKNKYTAAYECINNWVNGKKD